jgi:hypothetical protein
VKGGCKQKPYPPNVRIVSHRPANRFVGSGDEHANILPSICCVDIAEGVDRGGSTDDKHHQSDRVCLGGH